MAAKGGPPLDEIQWRQPMFPGGIHNNSVLFYFAESPFFDTTSNNYILFQQGLNNQAMMHYLTTRDKFEGRLRTMSGLEFMIAQEPAETGPGMGTGVWVVNKQTRRKRQGEEDEIVVHATYFIVGDNIYMAPSLADIMSSRLATISSSVSKVFSTIDGVQKWSPASGRTYQSPAQTTAKPRGLESKEATPMPDGMAKNAPPPTRTNADLDMRLVEESLLIQEKFGGEYMDENPIAGRPGEFHLSSTGRKVNLSVPKAGGALSLANTALPTLNTKAADNPLARTGKETKSPKTPSVPKPKRRKSKAGATPS